MKIRKKEARRETNENKLRTNEFHDGLWDVNAT